MHARIALRTAMSPLRKRRRVNLIRTYKLDIMLNVFLDTEFSNFIETDLISIGMVAQTGEEFYAEVPYPDAACSPFVREVVVPL